MNNKLKKVAALAVTVAAFAGPLLAGAQTTTTPGIPEAGVGGEAIINILLLAIAGGAAVIGGYYLVSTKDRA